MKVLVYESNPFGHRLLYVGYLIEALLEMGICPVIGIPEGTLKIPEAIEFLSNKFDHVEKHFLPEGFNAHKSERCSAFLSCLKSVDPDHVYVMSADGLSQELRRFQS